MSLKIARRCVWAVMVVAIVLTATMAIAQTLPVPGAETAGRGLAGMSATALLGTGLMGSLAVLGLLVKFITDKWMKQQLETVQVLQQVRDVIGKCGGPKGGRE